VVQSLSILGNSVRGIRFTTWRRLFHAIVIPIMTFGCPVWHPETGSRPSLILPLQVAQNDALRKMAGAFRTTPIDPLHNLLAIPPVAFTLRKLVQSYGDRLTRLPPSHLIRTILISNLAARAWSPFQPPSTLRRLLRENQRVSTFTLPLPTYDCSFSHVHVSPLPTSKPSPDVGARTRALISNPLLHKLSLFILESDTDDSFFHTAWLLYRSLTLIDSGVACEHSKIGALMAATADGLESVRHDSLLYVFLPGPSTAPYLLRGHKHPYLPFSLRIIASVSRLVLGAPGVRIAFRRFSPSWVALQRVKDDATPLLADPEDVAPLAAIRDRKADMYADWSAQYVATPHPQPYFRSCAPPDGNRPPPFIRGVLSRGSRRIFSAAVQLATGHSFTADYSRRFRPHAGDNTSCPCTLSPDHPVSHTADHVIFHCPRFRDHRASAFHIRPQPSLFSTFIGGYSLADFLWSTQALLYPLPPDIRPTDGVPPPPDPPLL
jgi:hypothetical protein